MSETTTETSYGNLNVNVAEDSLGNDRDGNPVYLKDIWPSSAEIAGIVRKVVTFQNIQYELTSFEITKNQGKVDQ